MSTPSSLPCPEPMPFSDDISGYAEVDFATVAQPIYTAQPNVVPVDTILSNQLGPVTNPVSPSVSMDNGIVGSPILPVVEESNAKPLLSSYSGSDINASTTLADNNLSFVSVNDIINNVEQPTGMQVPTGIQKFTNVNNEPKVHQNIPPPPPNNMPLHTKNNNLSNFIAKNDKPRATTEHFNPKPAIKNIAPVKNVEHFSGHMSIMDNIVLTIVIGAIIYYVVSSKQDVDLSKIPILAQLSDPNATTQNKIIIVVAVVVALVLIGRMLK